MQLTEWVEPWQNRWDTNQTGWDQGGPHPYLPALLEAVNALFPQPTGATIYAPGCGRAHNEAALATLGYNVTAEDFVQRAIDEARALYATCPRLTLRQADAFCVESSEEASYDMIFDRAMYCAIQPKFRGDYVTAIMKRLKPNGLLFGIPFTGKTSDTTSLGPPFATSLEDMLAHLSSQATLVHWQERPPGGASKTVTKEAIMIWRKRSARS